MASSGVVRLGLLVLSLSAGACASNKSALSPLEALRSNGKSTTRYPVREACAAVPARGQR